MLLCLFAFIFGRQFGFFLFFTPAFVSFPFVTHNLFSWFKISFPHCPLFPHFPTMGVFAPLTVQSLHHGSDRGNCSFMMLDFKEKHPKARAHLKRVAGLKAVLFVQWVRSCLLYRSMYRITVMAAGGSASAKSESHWQSKGNLLGGTISSLRMRARNVLRLRPRIWAALFLPLTFQWVFSSTRMI